MVSKGDRYRFGKRTWRVEDVDQHGAVHLSHEIPNMPHHASGIDWTVKASDVENTRLFEKVST